MRTHHDRTIELLTSSFGHEIEEHLTDESITEIRVNEDGQLWINRLGQGKIKTNITIPPARVRQTILTIAYSIGEVCNEDVPSIAAELPVSGHRFQGILPPLVRSPIIVIRKRAVRIFTLDELVSSGVVSTSKADHLKAAVTNRQNILIVGGTDSGKTTFANALLDLMRSTHERIVIIEDTQELQCDAQDVVYLRSKQGTASLRDLLRMSLRISPDRIVIGEVRGPEALDLLKAWNTGHGGGVSTIHANSAEKGLSRLEQLVEEATATHSKSVIADAINLLVYMEKSGTRRLVKEIVRVRGIVNNTYDTEELF